MTTTGEVIGAYLKRHDMSVPSRVRWMWTSGR